MAREKTIGLDAWGFFCLMWIPIGILIGNDRSGGPVKQAR